MSKKILMLSGSPKKNGNTALLIQWFCEGAAGTSIEVIEAASLHYRFPGCTSCRGCQKQESFDCVIDDDGKKVLQKMKEANVIVMATPLYFFSASAQLKVIFDRMFSLYQWDNKAGTMKTVLRGKTFALIASAYEDVGLDALERPFALTAEYTGMKFASLLIPNAGVSGEISKLADARQSAIDFGKKLASI